MSEYEGFDKSSIEYIVRGIVQQMLSANTYKQSDTLRTASESKSQEIAEEAKREAQDSAGKNSSGASLDKDNEAIAPGLAAFKVYWDDSTGTYKMHDPVVSLPNGSTLSPDAPAIAFGSSYYLHVYLFKASGEETEDEYKSEITDFDREGEMGRGSSCHWCIPIADVGAVEKFGFVTQHHVGVASVGGSGSSGTEEIDVVVDVEYYTGGDHPKLVQKKRKVTIVSGSESSETSSDVFVATPHVAHDGY